MSMDKFEQVFARHHAVKTAYCSNYVRGCEWGFKAGQQPRQAEVDRLSSVLAERTEEWLEVIKCGTYFQEISKPLKDELDKKDKQIEELERSCISYKNQRDDNAQKLMVKSVHYSSIQEELAKLKDRLELAHHLATQSTWSSLKQLRKVVKALRGKHE